MMIAGGLGVLIGFFLLMFGQRFFWLTAGFVAFLYGWKVLSDLFGSGWITFLLAMGLGLGLTWLAVRFIRVVAYLLGFLVGAIVSINLSNILGFEFHLYLLILLGGFIGIAIMAMAFEWALVLFTAWAGTAMIMVGVREWIHPEGVLASIVFGLLMLLGVLWQGLGKLKIKSLHRVWG